MRSADDLGIALNVDKEIVVLMADYETFEFPPEAPNYAIKRYLANVTRDRMEAHDQTWIIDQIIEFQAPEAIETVQKLIDGFFPKATAESPVE